MEIRRLDQQATVDGKRPRQAAAPAPDATPKPLKRDAIELRTDKVGKVAELRAKQLFAATLDQTGTNEAEVYRILGQLHSPAEAKQLDAAFRKLAGMSVEAMLKKEMSGSQHQRAVDLFTNQRIDWGASSGLAYHAEGAMNVLDDLGTAVKQHPIATAATVGVGIALSMRAPSLMAAAGLGTLGWQGGRFVRQEAGALTAKDAETRAKRQIAAGNALGQVAMSVPGTTGNVRLLKGAFNAARKAEGAGAAAKAFLTYESTWGRVLNFRRPYSPDVGGKIDAGPATGNAVQDMKNYWAAVQKSKDPSAIMARDLIKSYQNLTPKARAQTVAATLKEMTPAMRTRLFTALKTIGEEKNTPLAKLVNSPKFWLQKPEAQLNQVIATMATGGEKDITSLIVAMGTGHTKIGQVMADSPVVPESWGVALRQLQKDLPPMPDADIAKMLKAAGMADKYKVGKLLGVASVGQVHLATDVKTGQTVVLKFLKPNVTAKEITQEFKVMETYLKPYLKSVHPEQARFLKDNLTAFRDGIIEEIDFSKEAANIQKFGKIYPNQARFQGIDLIEVAKNKTVLVMKPAVGVDFKDLATLPKKQQVEATQQYAHAMYQQIFGEKHYFHADPHPGNVKFNPETGKVVFMDMGATATVSGTDQRMLYELTFKLMGKDAKGLAKFYIDNAERISSTLPKEELVKAFQADLQRFFDRPGYSPNYMIETAKEINELAQKHGIWPKSANVWLTKTMFTMANVWNKSISTEDTLMHIGGPYMMKGLVQAFKDDPKGFAGTVARIAKTIGANPVTIARSALEVATVNPAVLDQVPQGFMTALRGIAAVGQTSAAGEPVPGAAAKKLTH